MKSLKSCTRKAKRGHSDFWLPVHHRRCPSRDGDHAQERRRRHHRQLQLPVRQRRPRHAGEQHAGADAQLRLRRRQPAHQRAQNRPAEGVSGARQCADFKLCIGYFSRISRDRERVGIWVSCWVFRWQTPDLMRFLHAQHGTHLPKTGHHVVGYHVVKSQTVSSTGIGPTLPLTAIGRKRGQSNAPFFSVFSAGKKTAGSCFAADASL